MNDPKRFSTEFVTRALIQRECIVDSDIVEDHCRENPYQFSLIPQFTTSLSEGIKLDGKKVHRSDFLSLPDVTHFRSHTSLLICLLSIYSTIDSHVTSKSSLIPKSDSDAHSPIEKQYFFFLNNLFFPLPLFPSLRRIRHIPFPSRSSFRDELCRKSLNRFSDIVPCFCGRFEIEVIALFSPSTSFPFGDGDRSNESSFIAKNHNQCLRPCDVEEQCCPHFEIAEGLCARQIEDMNSGGRTARMDRTQQTEPFLTGCISIWS